MYPRLLARMVYHVGSPAMFDGNMFLPDTGMPISRMRPQQHEVGGLAAGAVDGRDLDAEIVDDALLLEAACCFLNGEICR